MYGSVLLLSFCIAAIAYKLLNYCYEVSDHEDEDIHITFYFKCLEETQDTSDESNASPGESPQNGTTSVEQQ